MVGFDGRFGAQRRTLLQALGGTGVATLMSSAGWCAPQAGAVREWVSTTRAAPWRRMPPPSIAAGDEATAPQVFIAETQPQQTIAGFGAAFSELSWDALAKAASARREAALDMLFSPGAGVGLNLNLCRTPIGASDFARDWYSYDETPGDFALRRFSIARDQTGLIPFIKAAQARRPDLRLWASPWSPPSWMKTNGHYAQAPSQPGHPPNGLAPDRAGVEGRDSFIQEARYFEAYADYFRRYVEAYRAQGIPITTVMPQNEFNSAQPFPSCCWTPEGLGRFIPYLGRAMEKVDAQVFFGTLERSDAGLLSRALSNADAARYIKGVGVQWAGKGALPELHQHHRDLPIWATEQECGDGRNDWRYARYAWSLMRRYFTEGAGAYMYWNIALPVDAVSSWGWRQNSLLTVDPATGSITANPEYHVLRHASGFVRPGARLLPSLSYEGYENLLAFRNPDGGVVILAQNDLAEPMPIRIGVKGGVLALTLPSDSFNTIVV